MVSFSSWAVGSSSPFLGSLQPRFIFVYGPFVRLSRCLTVSQQLPARAVVVTHRTGLVVFNVTTNGKVPNTGQCPQEAGTMGFGPSSTTS